MNVRFVKFFHFRCTKRDRGSASCESLLHDVWTKILSGTWILLCGFLNTSRATITSVHRFTIDPIYIYSPAPVMMAT